MEKREEEEESPDATLIQQKVQLRTLWIAWKAICFQKKRRLAALGKIRVKHKFSLLKHILHRWAAISRSQRITRNKLKALKAKMRQKLLPKLFKEWTIYSYKHRQTMLKCRKIQEMIRNALEKKYFNAMLAAYKQRQHVKENTKIAIEFWYNKMLTKSFSSWLYFTQMQQYRRSLAEKASVFMELKLIEKGLRGFKRFCIDRTIKQRNHNKAFNWLKKKLERKVFIGFKRLPDIRHAIKAATEHCVALANSAAYRVAFTRLKKCTEEAKANRERLEQLEESLKERRRLRTYRKFFEALESKYNKEADKAYEETLRKKSIKAFKGYIVRIAIKGQNEIAARKNYVRHLKRNGFLALKKAKTKGKASFMHAFKVLETAFKKICWRKFTGKIAEYGLELTAENFRKTQRKKHALGILRGYWEKQNKKIESMRIAKRHSYIFKLRTAFFKLRKYVGERREKRVKTLKARRNYKKILKQKCWSHFLTLLGIAEQKHNKQEIFQKTYRKKRLRAAFERLCYYNYRHKTIKDKIKNLNEKWNKRIASKALKKLCAWSQLHSQKILDKAAELEKKRKLVQKIVKRIYWNKFAEYTKSRQIKAIQKESADNTYYRSLAKKCMKRWICKYQALRKVQLAYQMAERLLTIHLFRKTVVGLQQRVMEKQQLRKNLRTALKHWARAKYKICFIHWKYYTQDEKRKRNELKQAIEDRSKVLRKAAIQKWLQVGFYWINKKTGADNLLVRNQRAYCLALKYGLYWLNKTLASRKSMSWPSRKEPRLLTSKVKEDKVVSTILKEPPTEKSREKAAQKKSWELMQWLHSVTKPVKTTVTEKKPLPKTFKVTPVRGVAKGNMERRVKEIEEEILTFSTMKTRLKALQTEKGKDSTEVQELRKEVIGRQPKVRKLLDEISTLKKTISK